MVYIEILSFYDGLLIIKIITVLKSSDLDCFSPMHVGILTILRKVNLLEQQMISTRVLKVKF